MRAWEFITEDRDRAPEITLRGLNRQNREVKEQEASHRRHAALVRVMYADPDRELKQIELEKARLELEQQKTELGARRTMVEAEGPGASGPNGAASAS